MSLYINASVTVVGGSIFFYSGRLGFTSRPEKGYPEDSLSLPKTYAETCLKLGLLPSKFFPINFHQSTPHSIHSNRTIESPRNINRM
jgi:hypothetical protein